MVLWIILTGCPILYYRTARHQMGNQVTICLTSDSVEKTKQIFEALQQGGQVRNHLEETPFSPGLR